MKIKKGFELHNVCGEHVIVACGEQHIDFSKVISLNESAAYLWNAVAGEWDFNNNEVVAPKDFDAETLANLLLEEYDVDKATAQKDAEDIFQKWASEGLTE